MKARLLVVPLSLAASLFLPSCAVTAPLRPAPLPPGAYPAITGQVQSWQALPGFLPLYWDAHRGALWLEIAEWEQDFLYVTSLPGGLGSNDIGLDRGQLGETRLVRFTRSGNRVLLVQRNLAFRAGTAEVAEQRAVEDSFATSVLAGFTVEAEQDGRVLVDATDFFLRDAHDVIGTLNRTQQGAFKLDSPRSAVHLPRTKGFPRNTEVEVILTFSGDEPGRFVRDVTPDPRAITLRQRHSLIRLPDPGYEPRVFDPRAGYFPLSYADYSGPIAEPITQRLIVRHRLQKQDPAAAQSAPVTPITYYVDPATPEPIRTALLEGARWWSEAFEAAGFIDAFRVELLPPDADPQDVRYHTIQWVHRATRGWSYGNSIVDPRTGEIIKGHVSLGSLRVRHDYLLAEGLLAPYETGQPASPVMEQMALARLRQLAAHEVGHTLGLAHNFAASRADRASVMDYPSPLAALAEDGSIDLSQAYATGIGEWDKVAIAAGYAPFPPGADERAEIAALLREARERGLSYLTDQDARPAGGAHPEAHLWDHGDDPVAELERVMGVRAAALARFGEAVIPPGRPLATLEEALVPTYLAHRYQVEAVVKLVGGQRYTYALRGDGQTPLAPVSADEQERALEAVLETLAPPALRLPDALLSLLPPRPAGFPATRELFARRTGVVFDVLAPAEAAATLTLSLVLHPQRANRLVQQHALDADLPGLDNVIAHLLETTWNQSTDGSLDGELQRVVNAAALAELFRLGAHPDAGPQVQAIVTHQLTMLRDWLGSTRSLQPAEMAHRLHSRRLIDRYLADPKEFAPPPAPPVPPGAPIGAMLHCASHAD